jgi:hypothetical protein
MRSQTANHQPATGRNTMRRTAVIFCLAALPLGFATAASAGTANFEATFAQIYSASTCRFPTVFCGSGTVAGFGSATSTVLLTSIAPVPGSDCRALTAVRTISLDNGSGSLSLAETGTICPPNPAASGAQGNPFTVDKNFTIAGGTGVFAGAAGSGTDINRSAGNSQVSEISGTLTQP